MYTGISDYYTTDTTYQWVEITRYPCDSGTYYEATEDPSEKWRWYDIFRTWAKLKTLVTDLFISKVAMRVQNHQSVRQRNKQKRRTYLQKLRTK